MLIHSVLKHPEYQLHSSRQLLSCDCRLNNNVFLKTEQKFNRDCSKQSKIILSRRSQKQEICRKNKFRQTQTKQSFRKKFKSFYQKINSCEQRIQCRSVRTRKKSYYSQNHGRNSQKINDKQFVKFRNKNENFSPIHGRQNRFKLSKMNKISMNKSEPKNLAFIAIKKQKLQNFNEYSLQYINKIQNQAKKLLAAKGKMYPNKLIHNINASQNDTQIGKMRGQKIKQLQIKNITQDQDMFRPWSNLSFDFQQEQIL